MKQRLKDWIVNNIPLSLMIVSQSAILILCGLLILLALVGCKSKEHIVVDSSYTRDTCYIERRVVDTIVTTEADTALTRLLVECDEHNNALVAIIEQHQGERVTTSPVIKYVNVRDEAGDSHRQAYIDLAAYAAQVQTEMHILEEKVAQGKVENKKLSDKLDKQPKHPFLYCLLSFIIGCIMGFVLILLITSKSCK